MGLTEWLRQRIENSYDDTVNAFTSIDVAHHEVHEGDHYTIVRSATVNAGQNIDVLVTAPATKYIHLIAEFTVNNSGVLYLYENPTINANGTTLTIYNNDRNSANTTGVLAFHTPTVGATGTTILTQDIIGSNSPSIKIGGSASDRHEFILKQGEQYLFRFTADNISTTGAFNIYFYEHD